MRVGPIPLLLAILPVMAATGAYATVADDLCAAGSDPCVVDTTVAIAAGSVVDLGSRALHFGPAARVTVGAGPVTFMAGSVRFLPGARMTAAGAGIANVEIIATGAIALEGSGSTRSRIDLSATFIAGVIALRAGTGLTVAGDLLSEGRADDADGGAIELEAAEAVTVSGVLSVNGGELSGGGFVEVIAGGSVSFADFVDISGGDFGGGELDVVSGGDVTVGQEILANGGGFVSDGGTVSIDARGAVRVMRAIKGDAAGDSEDGGGTGGDVEITADGDVVIAGPLQLPGAFPDGEGGSVFIDSGGTVTQSALILLRGNGIDGCGGSMFVSAARDVTLDRIDVSGGSCGGGDVSVQGFGTVQANGLIVGDGTTGISDAAVVELVGRDVVTNDVIRVSGGSTAANGLILVTACDVTVNQASELRTTGGIGGGTTIAASGRATVHGKLLASGGGVNRIQYRELASPPVIDGTTSPAALLTLNPALTPCPGATAECGDGALDPGEQCDDGNSASCDGCSASCRQEACGNGRVECDEECDAGVLNGVPGSGCDAQCVVVPLPGGLLLFPGGRTRNSCMAEWQIRNPGGEVHEGFPSRTQSCIDGDPACDLDGSTDGDCVYQVAVCGRVTDARLPGCDPGPLESISINSPKLLDPPNPVDAANGTLLRNAVAELGLTVRSGSNVVVPGVPDALRDHCTAAVGLSVPHPAGLLGSKVLNMAARDDVGRMRENKVTLICLPNTAVCGNGTREVGEQCDDGNRTACDGCAATCRVESCGDGIVECGEQCDDGPANGTPDSKCTAACAEVVPALRIPGGGSRRTDCLLETALDLQTPIVKGDGTPSNKQQCTDDDPACDFDPTPGACQFHLWLCLGGGDGRLECPADSVATVEVAKPSARDAAQAALRQALVQRLGAVSLPSPAGERCTARIDVDVPAGRGDGKVGVRVRNALGIRDTDTIKLKCVRPRS